MRPVFFFFSLQTPLFPAISPCSCCCCSFRDNYYVCRLNSLWCKGIKQVEKETHFSKVVQESLDTGIRVSIYYTLHTRNLRSVPYFFSSSGCLIASRKTEKNKCQKNGRRVPEYPGVRVLPRARETLSLESYFLPVNQERRGDLFPA